MSGLESWIYKKSIKVGLIFFSTTATFALPLMNKLYF